MLRLQCLDEAVDLGPVFVTKGIMSVLDPEIVFVALGRHQKVTGETFPARMPKQMTKLAAPEDESFRRTARPGSEVLDHLRSKPFGNNGALS